MNNKIVRNIGAVASIIGAIITGYGFNKFSEAKSMVKTLEDGDALFGGSSSNSINIWASQRDNYKLMLIIGAIILVIGIIFLISGIISGSDKTQRESETIHSRTETNMGNSAEKDIQERLNKLEELKEKKIITDAEYLEKRKDILSSL